MGDYHGNYWLFISWDENFEDAASNNLLERIKSRCDIKVEEYDYGFSFFQNGDSYTIDVSDIDQFLEICREECTDLYIVIQNRHWQNKEKFFTCIGNEKLIKTHIARVLEDFIPLMYNFDSMVEAAEAMRKFCSKNDNRHRL